MKRRTGYHYNENFLKHHLDFGNPETPERLNAVNSKLKESGLIEKLVPIPSSFSADTVRENILKVHSPGHLSSVEGSGITGMTALEAVGGCLSAADAVVAKEVDNAFCAVRPPGHHAHNNGADYDGPGQGEGFCFYNNTAITARYLQSRYGMKNILIIDWDYHHGNGTEWTFYSDPAVFFFSTHILYGYPGTGSPERRGEGPGAGYNLNVPLDPGADDTDIFNAWENVFFPALEKIRFKPDFILISAGFDSREGDYLGNFQITDNGFAELTRKALSLADRFCGGRLISILEGGYTPEGLANAVYAHTAALAGNAPEI